MVSPRASAVVLLMRKETGNVVSEGRTDVHGDSGKEIFAQHTSASRRRQLLVYNNSLHVIGRRKLNLEALNTAPKYEQ